MTYRDSRERSANHSPSGDHARSGAVHVPSPGKRTLTEQLASGPRAERTSPLARREQSNASVVQHKLQRQVRGEAPEEVHGGAEYGVNSPSGMLPYLDVVQRAFGRHDVRGVQSHTGETAQTAAHAMGAQAYATANHGVFANANPSGGTTQRKEQEGAAPGVGSGLIVADGASAEGRQMTKSAFLALLRARITETAVAVLPRTWSADACLDLQGFFARQSQASAVAVERLVRRYLGSPKDTAAAYVDAVCAKLRPKLEQWGRGQKMSWALGGSGVPEAIEAELSAAPDAPGGADIAVPGGPSIQRTTATVGDLGPGTPLDAPTASRMERAFGRSFAAIELHRGHDAGREVAALGVDAIAVGTHVAFRPDAYLPGTSAGDRLIAHELGHTLQQHGAGDAAVQHLALAGAGATTSERDADRMADEVGARLAGSASHGGTVQPARQDDLTVRGGKLCCGSDNHQVAAQQPALHQQGQNGNGDPFAHLPADTVAIGPNGVYAVANPGRGITDGFSELEIFSATGVSLGAFSAPSSENDDYVSYVDINNYTNGAVRGATDLTAWYLTHYTSKPYFEVHTIVNDKLYDHLTIHLGMDNHPVVNNWVRQLCSVVEPLAQQRLHQFGWQVR